MSTIRLRSVSDALYHLARGYSLFYTHGQIKAALEQGPDGWCGFQYYIDGVRVDDPAKFRRPTARESIHAFFSFPSRRPRFLQVVVPGPQKAVDQPEIEIRVPLGTKVKIHYYAP